MREESSQGFSFERQRMEVGLGEQESKNKAKKSGKALSADPPSPAAFFQQYESTLEKNREVEWLNGERDSPQQKVKKPNPIKKEHQLPAFWKKQENKGQYFPSIMQAPQITQEVSSVVSARIDSQKEQSPNSGIKAGLKMFNSLLGQKGQALQIQAAASPASQSKADEELSSNSTPRFKEQDNHKQPTPQSGAKPPLQTPGSATNPLSRLLQNKQIPNIGSSQANSTIGNRFTNIFMGSPTTNNNTTQPNIDGFTKQRLTGFNPKNPHSNSGDILNKQQFNMMKTVKLLDKREGASMQKNTNNKKLLERCMKYREKIREMVKTGAGERQRLIDIVSLMTIDHPKPLEREFIIHRSQQIAALYEQIQQGKRNRGKLGTKAIDNAEDARYPGFNLNDFLASSKEFTAKRIAEVPEEKMKQIKSSPLISKLYARVKDMSCQQFARKLSLMMEKMKSEMVGYIEKFILLLDRKRQAEALALKCQQEGSKLRSRRKAIEQQLAGIKSKQQYFRDFFAKCCRHLEVSSPKQLPKEEISYCLDSLQELTDSSHRLKGELEEMRQLLKDVTDGAPHKDITSYFCAFSRTFLQLLQQLQG